MASNNINFSIPAGADPMGVGGFDLGRSSYDPIASIKEAWATDRQDRIMADEKGRQEYERYMKNLPPAYESVNGKISGELNQKVVDMGKLAYQRYKSGMFSPWARTESGAKTEAELSQMENYVAKVGPVANKLDEMYKKAYEVRSNPENFDKIDIALTDKNMQDFANAKDIDEAARLATNPLVILKPTPIELNKYMMEQYAKRLQGEDKTLGTPYLDNTTGKMVQPTTTEVKESRKKAVAKQIYEGSDAKYKNAIDIAWGEAKQSGTAVDQKTGVPITKDDWIYRTFAPSTAIQKDANYVAKDDGSSNSHSWGFGRNPDKTYDFNTSPPSNIPVKRMYGAEAKDDVFGSEATIQIGGAFDKGFLGLNTQNTINTETGKPAIQNTAAKITPIQVSALPTATEKIEVITNKGKTTILKGEPIPASAMPYLTTEQRGTKVKLEPFVISKADYTSSNQTINVDYGGVTESENVTKKATTETIIQPYSELLDAMTKEGTKNKYDMKELSDYVNALMSNLNQYHNSPEKQINEEKAKGTYNDVFVIPSQLPK